MTKQQKKQKQLDPPPSVALLGTRPVTAPTAALSSVSSSSSVAIMEAAKRLEEKKRELKALKAILLKKHKSSTTAVAAGGVPAFVPAPTTASHDVVGDKYQIANEKTNKEATATIKKEEEPFETNASIKSKSDAAATAIGKKRQPLTYQQIKHKQRLLRMRSKLQKNRRNNPNEITMWDGIQMMASEIVFACTPMNMAANVDVGEEDEELDEEQAVMNVDDDGNLFLCSAVEKHVSCLDKGKANADADAEPGNEENSILIKPNKGGTNGSINVGFMPKFKHKSSEAVPVVGITTAAEDDKLTGEDLGNDSTASITSDSLIKVLLEHQQQRKQVRAASEGNITSYEIGTSNSIVTRSTTASSDKRGDNENVPPPSSTSTTKQIFSKKALSCNKATTTKAVVTNGNQSNPILLLDSNEDGDHGKATADAPLLLLSQSIENLILLNNNGNANGSSSAHSRISSHKKPSLEASQRIIRLLSKDSTSAVKLSKKGDTLSFTATKSDEDELVDFMSSGDVSSKQSRDDMLDLPSPMASGEDDMLLCEDEYQDMDQKMMLQVRLAQLKKKHRLHRKLAKQQQQEQAKVDAAAEETKAEDDRSNSNNNNNLSSHSHLTKETTKCANTTTASQHGMLEESREEDAAVAFVPEEKESNDQSAPVVGSTGRDDGANDVRDDVERVERRDDPSISSGLVSTHDDALFPQGINDPDRPLDAEELYKSTYRSERKRKDLEEMKQILDHSAAHRHNGDSGGGVFNIYGSRRSDAGRDDSTMSSSNVYDLQRASNFSALQVLRQRHLDVVRLQLQE